MASTTNKREEKAQEKAIDRTIEETKDNTKRVLQEAKRELPEFTAAFHDYQEQNINAIREMTSTFLESQKEVAKSIQSATAKGRSPNGMLSMDMIMWPYSYWTNPQSALEAYSKIASNFADTAIAATRLSNEMMVASVEATRTMIRRELKDTQAISKYMVDTARAIEEMP